MGEKRIGFWLVLKKVINKIITALILFVILATSVVPVGAGAQPTTQVACEAVSGATWVPGRIEGMGTCNLPAGSDYLLNNAGAAASYLNNSWPIEWISNSIGWILQRISALGLIISGLLLDKVIDVTVVNMSENLGPGSSVGTSISEAWGTLRDIANMVFIFVLLYTAFNYMFSVGAGNVGRNIAWIIIIALIINFSLFFSRVVIDASNVISLGFYKAIANAGQYEVNLQNGTQATSTNTSLAYSGISGGYMRMLGIHSFFSTDSANLSGAHNILIIGIMSSVFMLITSVILLIVSVMFAARFVILIFLMVLSPVAFVMYIIPGSGKFNDWWRALINQSFFAPVFFGLTWVVFKIGGNANFLNGIRTSGVSFTEVTTDPNKAIGLILNYVIVIGFSIFALTTSKKMASSLSHFAAVSTALGTAAIGGAAWVGRTTIGRAGKYVSERADLQGAKTSSSRTVRTAARLGLYASEKARDATFDARNAKIPTNVIGEAIQGTIGRTGFGKKLGLNDVNIPNVPVGQFVKTDLLGTAGTKGYVETKADSDKRVREREAKESTEFNLAQNKKAINDGAFAPAGSALIGDMEKSLAKLSDKETETLVASNRELLKSQNFANAISVKQLEAINKSDQFSDSEKNSLRGKRFLDIDSVMKIGGSGASSVKDKIKALADSELEMIDSKYIEDEDFVAQLKSSQIDSINKGSKFTSSQKEKLKNARMAPIVNAIRTGNTGVIKSEFRKADIKTKIIYLKTPGPGGINVGLDPDVLDTYNSKTLSRMAGHDDMTDGDIRTLRTALLTSLPATHSVVAWLNHADKGMVEFPP